ncbi:MAG: cysteine--tRNA ligase [Herpetosiphon sp.]
MSLVIYNTLARKKEPFTTIEPGMVRMYVCGPTVYDDAHIGHAMSALTFDVVRRYLEYRKFKVLHVQNFTDVDDKIIARALAAGRDPIELAEQYIAAFHVHLADLNILPANSYPRATQSMIAITNLIGALVDRDLAYESAGDVYFRVRSDADYGKLSHRNVDDMRAGIRMVTEERKEDPLDFALWKKAKPGEPAWDSPWSAGRPGWHIECSAMNLTELGEQIDIHGGGNDLIFPHHENEIAQTESVTGRSFARFWMHNGMLQLRGEKMSKSLGNMVSIAQFLAEHESNVLRLMVLGSSYRAPLTFDDALVLDNERKLERLRGALRPPVSDGYQQAEALKTATQNARYHFDESMDDDFNTPGALGGLFDLVRTINIARDNGQGGSAFIDAQTMLRSLAGTLGLQLELPRHDHQQADQFIDLLVATRTQLREAKQWALADNVRQALAALGIILEDQPTGTTWRRH